MLGDIKVSVKEDSLLYDSAVLCKTVLQCSNDEIDSWRSLVAFVSMNKDEIEGIYLYNDIKDVDFSWLPTYKGYSLTDSMGSKAKSILEDILYKKLIRDDYYDEDIDYDEDVDNVTNAKIESELEVLEIRISQFKEAYSSYTSTPKSSFKGLLFVDSDTYHVDLECPYSMTVENKSNVKRIALSTAKKECFYCCK